MTDTRSDAGDAIAELSFEDALKRLEAIVQQLESGDVPLETSIALYGEGDRLRAQCEQRLKAAQARIDQIQLGSDGAPALRPFDAE
jgi:exodeoxyribonuclease VII small subunit